MRGRLRPPSLMNGRLTVDIKHWYAYLMVAGLCVLALAVMGCGEERPTSLDRQPPSVDIDRPEVRHERDRNDHTKAKARLPDRKPSADSGDRSSAGSSGPGSRAGKPLNGQLGTHDDAPSSAKSVKPQENREVRLPDDSRQEELESSSRSEDRSSPSIPTQEGR